MRLLAVVLALVTATLRCSTALPIPANHHLPEPRPWLNRATFANPPRPLLPPNGWPSKTDTPTHVIDSFKLKIYTYGATFLPEYSETILAGLEEIEWSFLARMSEPIEEPSVTYASAGVALHFVIVDTTDLTYDVLFWTMVRLREFTEEFGPREIDHAELLFGTHPAVAIKLEIDLERTSAHADEDA